MAGAYPFDGLAGCGINRLAIDKHLIASFDAQPWISGIRRNEIGQHYFSKADTLCRPLPLGPVFDIRIYVALKLYGTVWWLKMEVNA